MININNLSTHSNALRETIDASIKRVLDRGWFVLGPEVAEFERKFSEYLGVNKTVSVANGTDAIELSLRAVGINKMSRVATVANAGMYTVTALMKIGAAPFFIDVDINTKLTTLKECRRALEFGVDAIVVTHLYGKAIPEIVEIASLCKAHSVPLIEDCAQSHGAMIREKKVGSFGDISAFSFYPTKNLGALGDGGAIATNNESLAVIVSKLRQYGWGDKYKVNLAGASNSRLDEIQAAILVDFIPLLDAWNERRREIARLYASTIENDKIILPQFESEEYVAHLYVIRADDRDGLQDYLKRNGVSSEVHYPLPDYKQSILKDNYGDLSLKNTEALSSSILTLPCYSEMIDSDVVAISNLINRW